jgi:hypothetical protein
MEDIPKYENRDQLYKVLINDLSLIKIEEKYYPQSLGNFHVTLSAKGFLLRYVNDRSQLTIEIASLAEPSKWYDLSFVKSFIYHPDDINPDDSSKDNATRIGELNKFLTKDFDLISDMFNSANYTYTRQKIDELLKQQFDQRFPGATL